MDFNFKEGIVDTFGLSERWKFGRYSICIYIYHYITFKRSQTIWSKVKENVTICFGFVIALIALVLFLSAGVSSPGEALKKAKRRKSMGNPLDRQRSSAESMVFLGSQFGIGILSSIHLGYRVRPFHRIEWWLWDGLLPVFHQTTQLPGVLGFCVCLRLWPSYTVLLQRILSEVAKSRSCILIFLHGADFCCSWISSRLHFPKR